MRPHTIIGYVPNGYTGCLVYLEVDIRHGIPGIQIIGLPEGAVREARERVRIALSNAGFGVTGKKILVGLGPAGIPKASAGLDLAIALSILTAEAGLTLPEPIAVIGELGIHGSILPAQGVLAAVDEAVRSGAKAAIVPRDNLAEAALISACRPIGVDSLAGAWHAVLTLAAGEFPETDGFSAETAPVPAPIAAPDFADPGAPVVRGTAEQLRRLTIAAAGGHHIGLFGPPGTGKTLGAHQLGSLLPPLLPQEMIETVRVWSLAGLPFHADAGVWHPPVRAPHHSASVEGMIGGGRYLQPGEASLAHNGLLILDEVAEYPRGVLQALRDPLESGVVRLVRAGTQALFPARAMVCLTANLCPCGSYGKPRGVCSCTTAEISRYWRKFGGAVMDRIAVRVACLPDEKPVQVSTAELRVRVAAARQRQRERICGRGGFRNSQLQRSDLLEHGEFSALAAHTADRLALQHGLTFRGSLHVLQMSRTIADLEQQDAVLVQHVEESAAIRCTIGGGNPWNWLAQGQRARS
ncbi:YifB family Mg chelatase-like AAA ATPase [Spirochaeta africana]|uniref:Mg chelatase-related protein n=1 Tax=Spirochaeta africana (strain ATCC 700263 / DSM 8902 / Z-7692) TaxID=889378 RepID=H9UGP0_SPIAZ|nr:YifB family Mg chelatase-like AAA ATPase [Spirochaeta africana]AFG36683.1 Mg chelatase-related protein [Spirochaeta africana DSM 8902]